MIDGLPWIAKAPGARKSYTMDFTDALPDGVTIQSADVQCQGVKCDEFSIVANGTMVMAWIMSGSYGNAGRATFIATLSDGDTIDPRTIVFDIRDVA